MPSLTKPIQTSFKLNNSRTPSNAIVAKTNPKPLQRVPNCSDNKKLMSMELSKKRYRNRSDKYLKRLMSLTDEIKHNIRGGDYIEMCDNLKKMWIGHTVTVCHPNDPFYILIDMLLLNILLSVCTLASVLKEGKKHKIADICYFQPRYTVYKKRKVACRVWRK